MGRGRQKAKHTKVARELKYFSPNTNYGALERELTHADDQPDYIDKWADVINSAPASDVAVEDDEYDDPYAADYEDDDEDEAVEPHSKSA